MSTDPAQTTQIAYALGQLGLYLRAAQWRAADAHGLTPTQVGALTLLHRRGPARVRALASQLGVRHATMSDVVAALARKALVAKTPDPEDGRAVRIALTAEGARVAAERDTVPEALQRALDALPPAEQAGLRRATSRLIRDLQSQGAIAPQRLCVTCRFFRPNVHTDAATPHHCAFVDAAFGDASLRFDCGDHDPADADLARRNLEAFETGVSADE